MATAVFGNVMEVAGGVKRSDGDRRRRACCEYQARVVIAGDS